MELFQDVATEDEFAGISGMRPGSPQVEQLKEHLKTHPEDNAECLAWLYTIRGNSPKAEEALKLVPEERRAALKTKINLVARDVAQELAMRKIVTVANDKEKNA